MIPKAKNDLRKLGKTIKSSLTYYLDLESKRVSETIDEMDAVMQAVEKVLSTERYDHPIYSERYGVSLSRLIGKDFSFIASELEREIKEALLLDERINAVKDLKSRKTGLDTMTVTFIVETIYGKANVVKEVHIS